ncbi:Fe-S oxidoreductase [Capnocytophaga stomatis]|uniref:YkgJ family cysteine cluster protein n=1 Tax=Capnocytophaga stomatis TaxID=1848904 RepID=UPI00194E54CB|nr:YkgJ family cysteine cluster protein [Capnocytophaga stomatis]GIJ96625.1 Fe-S oxidoreductase [Capnocytophaga stomatis]GIM50768.1 Fe-S oxidoreductase [Capnocytophaga stomatis]
MEINTIQKLAKEKKSENQRFFAQLKKKPPKNLDYTVQEIHDEITEQIDCLSCANCCKTTGPLLTNIDIERISKHLRLKPSDFITKYLKIDEENDYIFQSMPCPFLASDNYCLIYDVRPKACREYPHTDRKKIYQIANLTIKNTEICPIAYKVVEKMKEKL